MIAYSITNDTILTLNNKDIDFKHNIRKVLECEGLIIVHIFDSTEKKGYVNMEEQPDNNVYAFNSNGDLQWNIRELFEEDITCTSILLNENGSLVVYTFMGIAQIIDVKAKKVIGRFVTK